MQVGDIVLLKSGDMVPADLVVLWSSGESGMCYVETSNLDGCVRSGTRAHVGAHEHSFVR